MDEVHRILLTYIRGARSIPHSELLTKYCYIQRRLRDAQRAEAAVAETNREDNGTRNERDDDLNDGNSNIDRSNDNSTNQSDENDINDDIDTESETGLVNAIAQINAEIGKFGFRVERKHDQNEDLTLYYIYVNVTGDEIMKKDTRYSVNELQAIKQVVDLIVESPALKFSVARLEAIRAISTVTKKLLDASEYFLNQLVEEGWFVIVSARVKLGIRSLSELKSYLLDRYATRDAAQNGSLIACPVCSELVTEGYFCSQCQLGYHRKCDAINRQGSSIATGDCKLGHGELSLVG